ncbi:hypothetical protein AVEN_76743-1 [Araneus ventricosus]|uniref:Uncharacterized protein n=1 Tax=Araneus ventricosus TaxID=182803 RepID=A0A4Y2VCU8_ARAVE|nr:hypothetical protein AVEN_76743-1 [Araneus ventricosus]
MVIRKLCQPVLPNHPGNLNDSRCNRLITEAGVLVVITSHSPTPPVGSTYIHWRMDSRLTPQLLYPTRSKNPLTYFVASHPRTRGAPRWEGVGR